jgi:hypothetical protein
MRGACDPAAAGSQAIMIQHRVLDDARHSTITIDRPDAVIQAVRDLLDRQSVAAL